MTMREQIVILLLLLTISIGNCKNWISPCPNLFKYRPLIPTDDNWKGDITLTTPTELSGIWLRIVFDKAPLEVDTDFGEVNQRENNEYLIKQPDKRLKIGEKQNVLITVKYDMNSPPPQLIGFRLNARVICPGNGVIPRPEENTETRLGIIENELVSPCPDAFSYEPFNNTDIWFGNIKVRNSKNKPEATIKIILDEPALQLGNWFGEVTTPDNIAYTIRNPSRIVKPNEELKIRMFIKFKQGPVVPKVTEIIFNDDAVCLVPKIRVGSTTTTPDNQSLVEPSKWESPCPSIFDYRPIGPNDDTWQGELSISTETELSGVWLRLIFDGIPMDVNSEFGEVVQREATEYLIRRPDKGLRIGSTEFVKLSVKFDLNQPPPKIVGVRLNARVICPENGVIYKPGSSSFIEQTVQQKPETIVPNLPVLESPCPSIFEYEPLKPNDDNWFGDFTISTETELSGVWLRIVFDNPPIEVDSNFGEVAQREATEYLIRRPEKGLKIDDKERVTMRVKFNTSMPIPKLVGIRLNARVICPDNGVLIKPGEKISAPLVQQVTSAKPPIVTTPPPELQKLESSCPNIFQYRPFYSNENRWSGDLTISATQRLQGVYLSLTFDRPPIEVTSSFGEVGLVQANEYLISRPDRTLYVGQRELIDLTVKFANNRPPPHLVEIKLNYRIICPENNIFMITESATEIYEETTRRPTVTSKPSNFQDTFNQNLSVPDQIPPILADIPFDEIPDDPNIIDQKIVVFPKFYYIIQKYAQYSIIHIKRKKQN